MSKRKKYNPIKRIQKMSSVVTKGLAIGFVGGGDMGGCFIIDLKNRKPVKVSATLADAFGRVPHQWSMIQAVFCRRQDGQEYAKFQQVQTSAKYYEKDLESVFNDSHSELYKSCNPAHVLTAGWLVVNHEKDWCEKEVGDIFREFGAWEFLTESEAA
jgi:hypothetical protein